MIPGDAGIYISFATRVTYMRWRRRHRGNAEARCAGRASGIDKGQGVAIILACDVTSFIT